MILIVSTLLIIDTSDLILYTCLQKWRARIIIVPKKYQIFFLFIFVFAITIFVAAGLPNLEFHPGRVDFSYIQFGSDTHPLNFLASLLLFIVRLSVFISIVIGPLLIIFYLRKPRRWPGVLILIILAVLFVSSVKYLPRRFNPIESTRQLEFIGDGQPRLTDTKPKLVPPHWLVILFSLGMSVLIMGVLTVLWRRLQHRSHPFDRVAQEAEKTLETLNAGGDLKEGVVRCYYEMIRVISEHRGLERDQAMTTREFESYLEAMGLPGTHIKRLTRLFEKVRYGAKRLCIDEEREAVSCLTAIVHACKGRK